jgi:serine phosphatase RsbU (regulator of sigma subunit)
LKKHLYTALFLSFYLLACQDEKETKYRGKINQNEEKKVLSHLDSADQLRIKGQLSTAEQQAKQALNIAQKNSWGEGIASAENNLAYIYLYKSEFEQSMEHAVRALKVSDQINDPKNQASAHLYIGYIHQSLGDYEEVLPHFKESLKLRKKLNLPYEIGFSHSYLGNFYFDQANYDSALYHHQKALTYRIRTKDKRSIADSYLLIGANFYAKNQLDSAAKNYNKALQIYVQIDDKKRLGESYRNLYQLELARKDTSAAKLFLAKAEKTAKEIKAKDNLVLIYKEGAKLAALDSNYNEAYTYLNQHLELKEGMSGSETYRDAVKRIMAYKNEKEKKIKELEFKRKEERQLFYFYLAGTGMLFLVLFLIFLFNRLKLSRKQNDIIQAQKTQVDYALGELEEKNGEILDSIVYAKRIQSALLPSQKEFRSKLPKAFVLYQPKDIVAGDFYWVKETPQGTLIAVADCTGHGVPGALVSVVCINSLNRAVQELDEPQPARILERTKELVVKEFQKSEDDVNDGMDIALCLVNGSKISFSGAQNPLWVVRKNSTTIEEYTASKQPIGQFHKHLEFIQHEILLEKGDSFYLFSDGYKDQFGGDNGKKFKNTAFKKLIIQLQSLDIEKQKVVLAEEFDRWKGNFEQIDDVCVLGVKL